MNAHTEAISIGDDLNAALMSGEFIQTDTADVSDANQAVQEQPTPPQHEAAPPHSVGRAAFFEKLRALEPEHKDVPAQDVGAAASKLATSLFLSSLGDS